MVSEKHPKDLILHVVPAHLKEKDPPTFSTSAFTSPPSLTISCGPQRSWVSVQGAFSTRCSIHYAWQLAFMFSPRREGNRSGESLLTLSSVGSRRLHFSAGVLRSLRQSSAERAKIGNPRPLIWPLIPNARCFQLQPGQRVPPETDILLCPMVPDLYILSLFILH